MKRRDLAVLLAVAVWGSWWLMGVLVGTAYAAGKTVYADVLDTPAAGAATVFAGTATSVDVSATGEMTTIKGTLNCDEAVTMDTTLSVTTSISAPAIASAAGTLTVGAGDVVDVGTSGSATTVKGTFNVDEAASCDTTLTVTTSVTTPLVAGPAGTLTLGSASSHPTLPDDARLQFGSTAGGGDVRMSGELTTLTDGSATTVLSVVTGDGDVTGIQITYFLESSDGTDSLAETGTVQIAIIDDAGGVVASAVGEVSAQINSTVGDSLTTDWTVVTTDDQSIEVQCNADAIGLTPTTHQVRWVATYPSNVTITVP